MKDIEKWLKENGIEYRRAVYDSNYFGDGFQISGIQIPFYFDGIGNDPQKQRNLEKFMRRKRAYICKASRFGAGYSYRIMTVFDAARLEKHEKAVAEAVGAFWQMEHARRMQAQKAI